ncbi:MAG: ATP-binding protein [Christensenellaceae bacterium]|jgi:predicted AAA+ superfamily ATPase|nr:ATP-binding protein [Christensenellaceae bacterium]
MFKRKFINALLKWKNRRLHECLVVKGARQVGKTFIIREFGRQNYKHVIELNFLLNEGDKSFFMGGRLDASTIYSKLSLRFPDVPFDSDTLIFLDEIQMCAAARTALKPLGEDKRCDVIAAGSMLSIAYKDGISIPVGYERHIEMHAMDFEEFLWAKGVTEETISICRAHFINKQKVNERLNEIMLEHMRDYMVVGGMPSVVKVFLETEGNYEPVHTEQQKIIKGYLDDITVYAPDVVKPKIKNCYSSIPMQLAQETNRNFQYSLVEKCKSAKHFDTCFDWLKDAGLVKLCKNVSIPKFPLEAYKQKERFKVYLTDIGLLVAMYGIELKTGIQYNTLEGSPKDGIYENFIADILIKKDLPLNYFRSSKTGSEEIEFLYTYNSHIIPIEVKAGNGASYSLNKFFDKFELSFAYKFVTGNIGQVGNKLTLPLYMAMFL